MSDKAEDCVQIDDLISSGEEAFGSTTSPSLGESSVRFKEKSEPAVEERETVVPNGDEPAEDEEKKKKKRRRRSKEAETRSGLSERAGKSAPKAEAKDSPSPDATSSMKEFLEREKYCKGLQRSEGDRGGRGDDTLCDILASAAIDRYPSDFENATDEDIASFLEEMSKIAGALSPSSAPERTKSGGDSSKNPSEEEKSVEELLEEAEKLMRENAGLSKSASRSDGLTMPDEVSEYGENFRVAKLEEDIFQLIQQEVHKESEKIRRSPRKESERRGEKKGRRVNGLEAAPPKFSTPERRKNEYQDDKVEASSGSDLDDPIERHSKSEDSPSVDESPRDKDNLQKEITDVDKDFFDNLLRRSKERMTEGGGGAGMSASSSFGQEDFSHFLRILQGQSDREDEAKVVKGSLRITAISNDGVNAETGAAATRVAEPDDGGTIVFPEKEITEILEKELPGSIEKAKDNTMAASAVNGGEFVEKDCAIGSRSTSGKSATRGEVTQDIRVSKQAKEASPSIPARKRNQDRWKGSEATSWSVDGVKADESRRRAANSIDELYSVGLTPRLELFADAIPKLMADKSSENLRKEEAERSESEANKSAGWDKGSKVEIEDKKRAFRSVGECRRDIAEPGKMQDTAGMSSAENSSPTNPGSQGAAGISHSPNKSGDVTGRKCGSSNSSSSSNRRLSRAAHSSRSAMNDVGRNVGGGAASSELSSLRVAQSSVKSAAVSRYARQPVVNRSWTVTRQASNVKLSLRPSASKVPPIEKTTPAASSSTRRSSLEAREGHAAEASRDSRRNFSKDDFRALCREERRKNALLKEQMDSEAKLYKQQMRNMRTSFEEELFALKKQNIVLRAKIDELSFKEKRRSDELPSQPQEPPDDAKIGMLEEALEKQEGLINAYESENKRLIAETKRYQEEIRNAADRKQQQQQQQQQQQHASNLEVNERQRLNDTIKDLREAMLKLNLEITNLREKNADDALKSDDIVQQNSLLKEEVEMYKDQLRTKNDFINARLQAMTAAELESRKRSEDQRIELSSKTEQLRLVRIEYEKLERGVAPLEKELVELRVREGSLQEKLQVARSHVEREKQLTLKLKDQVILDNKKILDLNRQVREMERILKRKNPDSVSALILTAKSDHERLDLEKVKLLEDRVASLEGEIKAREEIGREKLSDLRSKFEEMKEKYALRVTELEAKLVEATTKDRKMFNDAFTQTVVKSMENKGVEARACRRDEMERDRDEKKEQKSVKVGPKSQNPKEDAHLIATIRGLKLELASKDKNFARVSKECQELEKTNKRLQKEREKLLNDRRNFKGGGGGGGGEVERNGRSVSASSDPRIPGSRTVDASDRNSNVYQNGNLSNGHSQRLSGSVPRLYDPLQYSENCESATVKKMANENEILKEELNKINKDFMTLKNKRLHDLNLLQEEHEREMAALVKEYSVKFGDSKVVKLQGQVNTQVAIITHLKQQIEKLRDYKEQVIVLKVEREHLENKVKILNEKVKYLSTPGTEQLRLLQDKITLLQQRHESREMTLQSLVRDLLRSRTRCRDCNNGGGGGEKGKNNMQLCYFRQELDNILGMLQEIANV